MKQISIILFLTVCTTLISQTNYSLEGIIRDKNENPIEFAHVFLKKENKVLITDKNGAFEICNINDSLQTIYIKHVEYETKEQIINLSQNSFININLAESFNEIGEVVISGNLKEVSKLESITPVEVFTPKFFQRNPTPNLFESLQNINGVRPQLNCAICNTGDIHINGLEGPYTMVLIDGMPIVSSLSTVYGLSGIPNALVERIEIVKGPASSLYGSEAIGGVINVITKKPEKAPLLSVDLMSNSYLENNLDIGIKSSIKSKINILTGINYFNYSTPIDLNNDNFTDVTLSNKISIFQKWNFKQKNNKLFSIAGRCFYEDRWGGEMNWSPEHRGKDSIYGESIYTTRIEIIGTYQLPIKEDIKLSFSANSHNQNSVYGDVPYIGNQKIGFSQMVWNKVLPRHDFIVGSSYRYIFYDDNTPATASSSSNNPDNNHISSVFFQDELAASDKQKFLIGSRIDYSNHHGFIFTPRIGYKIKLKRSHAIRLNTGTGFRVVNIFTEDHAALTGARDVIIEEDLKPEKSYNANVNYTGTFYTKKDHAFNLDITGFYTYFTNKIFPDYDSDPNLILYRNLNGYAISEGVTVNLNISLTNGFKLNSGVTFMNISNVEEGIKQQQILSEKFTGTWGATYFINKLNTEIDYSGNIYSPMRLPLASDLDPRNEFSPWWSTQNIQLNYKGLKNWEFYIGIKNLLNFTPNKGNPFIIARSNDPFDKNVQFSESGEVLKTPSNPYGLTFDPTYIFAPNQGVRVFFGIRFKIR
jgi:outer membrane receptor for ferrienterochelin and colicins